MLCDYQQIFKQSGHLIDNMRNTQKYKIIILAGSLRQSGSITWAVSLVRAFCQQGHEAILLVMGSRSEAYLPINLQTIILGKARTNILIKIYHLLLLRKICKSGYKRLEEWIYNRRVKKFLTNFEKSSPVDLIIKDFNTPTPAVFTGKKHLAILHEKVSVTDQETCKRAQDPYTKIAAVSESCAGGCRKNGVDVHHVLYNPLDVEEIRKRAEAFTVNDDYVVFVGALIDRKNVTALLEAWYCSGIQQKLYFIGRGEKQKILEKRAQELGVADRVVFTGFAPNPYPFIKSAKALILPSHEEPMGYVCFEALALDTPVIVAGFESATEFYDQDSIVAFTPKESFNARLAKVIINTVQHKQNDQHLLDKNSAIKNMSYPNVVKNYLQFMNM